VVFGEKGSGKTAIRLQIAERVRRHNEERPEAKCFLIPYDELNRSLDHFHRGAPRDGEKRSAAQIFTDLRLADHMDAILAIGVGRVVNALLGGPDDPPPANLTGEDSRGDDAGKKARAMNAALKADLLLLSAVYDQADVSGSRTAALRRKLRVPMRGQTLGWMALTWLGWIPAAAVLSWLIVNQFGTTDLPERIGQVGAIVLALLWLVGVVKTQVVDRLRLRRLGRKLARSLRMLPRTQHAYAGALKSVEPDMLDAAFLPLGKSDEARYAMLDRLRRVAGHFGFSGVLVLLDRVDEPTLVNGDADAMRAIVWPLFNNKFLQQDRFGIKMLLPVELRYALFRESSSFFQEARLDKQNLIERLSWTGAMLYDLCNARLAACRRVGGRDAAPTPTVVDGADGGTRAEARSGLLALFAEDVSRQDLVDALDQMHQPRDAFKFLYRCITEHCSNVTADERAYRIPRLILEQVRKAEAERVQQLYRGIRPA
jgi:hypothetical protein